MSSRPFRLNKADGKILGVCSGLSDHFDVDVTLIRIMMVLSLIATFPIVGFGYLVVAMVVQSGGGSSNRVRFDETNAPRLNDPAMDATRQRMRDLDERLQQLEANVTSPNNALAREIDSLR